MPEPSLFRHASPLLTTAALLLSACGDDTSSSTIGDELSTSETGLPTGDGDGDPTGDGDGDPTGDGDGDPTGDGDGDPTGDGDGDPTGDGDGDPTGDGDGDPTGDGDGDGDGDTPCPAGEVVCEDGIAKTCDGEGGFSTEFVCADECSPDLGGCVACLPGTGYCDGDLAYACLPDGSGFSEDTCDGLQGIACNANSGQCAGACTPEALGTSYIGCDYYPTITPNPLLQNTGLFSFAVAVANTTNNDATVTVTRGANMVTQVMVAANSVQVVSLPWVDALRTGGNNTGVSKIVADGAYRLRSTEPVTVYQYNPLQYSANGQFSYTNDASLLLPVTTWRDEVRVVAWNHFSSAPNWSAFYAVVAAEDGTEVTLGPSATGQWVKAGAGVAANGTGNVSLDSSDVLIVFTANANVNGGSYSDPSGTLVSSTKPVQVIGGHVCVYIPENTGYCDHIEESIPPLEAVGKDYFVTVPLINPPASTKARMVRIVATEANTALTYDPPVPGAPAMLANAGDVATVNATSGDFRISSEQKILVSEYMQGQAAGGNKGDPAMTLAVPVEQYRTSYLVHAPTNYTDSLANIVAPTGAAISVDGVPIANWTAIGATGYSVARVVLSNAGDGNHDLVGDEPFGIQVYGYGQYTSYWYPGGQNLDIVPQ